MEKLILTDSEMLPVMKDAYRRICTNIEFTGVENRVICITSCLPDDGKSTVSYGVARTFAENGKRVLLIDADMRKSELSRQKGFNKKLIGLSHLLSGMNTIKEVIYSTNHLNFYLIPTGVFPKNPTELLNKSRFKDLITYMKNTFDYIIVDTPPLGSVIDAAIIARECDGSVLVFTPDKVSRKSARNIRNQLEQANPNILGVIMNHVSVRSKGYNYGYKDYSYGYGGYGY